MMLNSDPDYINPEIARRLWGEALPVINSADLRPVLITSAPAGVSINNITNLSLTKSPARNRSEQNETGRHSYGASV